MCDYWPAITALVAICVLLVLSVVVLVTARDINITINTGETDNESLTTILANTDRIVRS